ncbi:MAG: hypothetical protein Q8S53_00695, partial [Brevundimonas sp.]|nr:hypothetical protein [Brevundimonas sp.]
MQDVPSFQKLVEDGLKEEPTKEMRRPLPPPVICEKQLAETLPQFEKWKFIGSGGMGLVYRAWHRGLQNWVAVKLLSPKLARDPRALARFQNEATLLAQLRHPNIVP